MKRTLLLGVAFAVTLGALGLAQSPGVNSNLAVVWTLPLDSVKRTYGAGVMGLQVSSAAVTDVFQICGATGITTRITKLAMGGKVGTAIALPYQIVRRTSADTGGQSAVAVGTPYDSTFVSASSVVTSWTDVPTALGTTLGSIIGTRLLGLSVSTTLASSDTNSYGTRPASALVLRSPTQCVAINFGTQTTITGNALDIEAEWTEE